MELALESLRQDWQRVVQLLPRLVIAIVVFLLLVWIGRVVGRVLVRVLERGKLTQTHKNFFRNLTASLFGLLGALVALNLLGLKSVAAGLIAGGGITAVALGFAFRGIGENLLAGFFLAFSRPFEVGDLVQSASFTGTVRSIDLRYTHIRTGDGKDVFIPSAQIFNEPLVNFTRDGLRRLSFVVGIDYADDAARALPLLLAAVKSVEGVLSDPAPSTSIAALQPQYVELDVGFWLDVFDKKTELLRIRSQVIDDCRRTLRENGFTVSSEVSTAVQLGQPPGAELRAKVTGAPPLSP